MPFIEVFRGRLQAKVLSLIIAILVLGFGTLVLLNIRRESNAIIAMNRETSQLLATTIVESIDNVMVEARPDIVQSLIQQLKTELTDLKHLEVYRNTGVEAFSDLSTFEEVDLTYDFDPSIRERILNVQRTPGK